MIVLLCGLIWAVLVHATCYEPNIAHHIPEYDAHDPVLQEAFERLDTLLTVAVADSEHATNSFSVEVTSSTESLWSLHHTARERNASRPDIPRVNGDALYRIASITKSFTVLGLLYQHAAGNLSLDDTIDTYIDELRRPKSGSIPWKDITLRSLASQLSGIPREFAQADLINAPESMPELYPYGPEDFGLPPISRKGLIACDEYGDNFEPPCARDDLIHVITGKPPLFAPNQKSSYSNVAFELLGLAIANVTGKSYEHYINHAIFEPLGMSKSTLDLPPDSAGVIPAGWNYWDVDAGVQNPTGGIYSSSTDLSKYLRYILTHYNGITHALNWANVASFSDGLNSGYGTPWEIFRTDRILVNSSRTVSFITKSGGLPGYTSIIITLPEYDLGITILVAGPESLFSKLLELVTVETVRAAEKVAIAQLQRRYAGTFVPLDGDHINSSLILSADHRGLIIDEIVINGTDIYESPLGRLAGKEPGEGWKVLLVPTLLFRNETTQEGAKWRFLVSHERTGGNRPVWDDFCAANIDVGSYGGLPMNEVVFFDNKDKVVERVELTAFKAKLVRKEQKNKVQSEQGVLENLEL